MKISNNVAGNYNPFVFNKVNQAKQPQQVQQAQQNQKPEETNKVITSDEKRFFANMYPDKSGEINDYHFYGRNGKMSGVTLGSNIDRRG